MDIQSKLTVKYYLWKPCSLQALSSKSLGHWGK